MTPIDGLSIELDAMMADGGEYVDYVPEGQATSSLMIAAEYAVALGDTFAIYGTAGVGMINSVYTDLSGETTFDATGAGYQLAVGARAKVTEGIAVFGEVKYQNSFEPIGISDGIYTYDVQYPNVTVLSGLRFEF